jgi:hypothetical protein
VFFTKHSWGDENKMDGIGWHVEHMGKDKCIRGFGIKDNRKRPFGRPRQGWENIIKTNLKYITGCSGLVSSGSR